MQKRQMIISYFLIFLINAILISISIFFYIGIGVNFQMHYQEWIPVFLSIIIFYLIIPGFLGSTQLVKIIKLKKSNSYKLLIKNIETFTIKNTIFIFFSSTFWTLAFAFPESVKNTDPLLLKCNIYYLLVYLFIIFPTYILNSILAIYTSKLKKHFHRSININFSPGKTRLWIKFLILTIVSVLIPASILFLDSLFSSLYGNPDNSFAYTILDMVMMMICIITGLSALTVNLTNPVTQLVHSFNLIKEGNLNTRVSVTSKDELGRLLYNFNLMAEGLQDRENIKNTFGKFVSPEIAEQVLNTNSIIEGEERFITVLFTDIENYTNLSENLDPKTTIKLLNEYYDALINIVKQSGGTVNKFIGDAIMVIFNAPLDDADHIYNAVQCGKDIINITSRTLFGDNILLKTRVGINSGYVIAGRLGGKDRYEYTVIGDTVNLAQRLEQHCKIENQDILISAASAKLLEKRIPLKRLGKVKLKGMKSETEYYTLDN